MSCFTLEKASQNFPPSGKQNLKTFSVRACTWQKILLRLQVWNLFAVSKQIMHEADYKKLEAIPVGDCLHANRTC